MLEVVSEKSRFHSMPTFSKARADQSAATVTYDSDKVAQCHESRGHVLRVRAKEIYCERCPAVWRDEGF